jgi:hypothetical protein
VGNATYAFTPGLSLVGDVQFLTPADANSALPYRWPAVKTIGGFWSANMVDKINYWKAGVKYALTSSDNVDLGYEQMEITPTNAGIGATQVQKFVTLGYGHTFSPGSSMKVLYQLIDTSGAVFVPFLTSRGALASAELQFKF